MASSQFDCLEKQPGLSESQSFTVDADSELKVAFESDKCFSAWIEYTLDDGPVSRLPILPLMKRNQPRQIMVPEGAECKIVASVGRNGHFRGRVYY